MNNISNLIYFPGAERQKSNMKTQDVSTSSLLTEIDNTEEMLQLNTRNLRHSLFEDENRTMNEKSNFLLQNARMNIDSFESQSIYFRAA